MRRSAKHFTNALEVIAPIPLLCFSIYGIFVTTDGLWIRAVGATTLITTILIALMNVISLFIIVIILILSKEEQLKSFSTAYIISLFFTGGAVMLVLFYSSYKKELQAQYFTSEYLSSTNGSLYETSFDLQYNDGTKKMQYYHNRTLLIHDLTLLFYALEILLVIIARLFADQIVSFFKPNAEELDVENAPAAQEQNPFSIPKVDDTIEKKEEVSGNKEETVKKEDNSNEKKEDEKSLEEVKSSGVKDDPVKESNDKNTENNKRNNVSNVEQKMEFVSDEPKKNEEKKEKETSKFDEPNLAKPKDKNDKNLTEKQRSKENSPKIDKLRGRTRNKNVAKKDDKFSKTQPQKDKKKPFIFDQDENSSSDDLLSPVIFSKTNVNTSRRRDKKKQSTDEFDDLDLDLDLSPSRPTTQRRTRKINESREMSPFGFTTTNESSNNSIDDLLNGDFSKTSPAKKSYQSKNYSRKNRTTPSARKKQKSPFGFDLSSDNSTDDLLNDY